MNSRLLLFVLLAALLACEKQSNAAPEQEQATKQNASLKRIEEELAAQQRNLSLYPPKAAEPIIRSVIKLKAGGVKIPADALQEITEDNGNVIILRNSSWFSRLPVDGGLDEFVRPPADLMEDDRFQKLVKGLSNDAGLDDTVRTLATAAVDLNEVVLRLPSERAGSEVAALKEGKAGPVNWTRLLVALCRAAKLPAREVHGFLITPGQPGAERRVWLEVLQEDYWRAFDPWLTPAPSDDGDYALEALMEGGEGQYVPAPVMSLHVTVVRGQPDAAVEKFLDSSPEVLACEATRGNALDRGEPDTGSLPKVRKAQN
jgi:hypothetical protein